ncbi:MAG: sigma factor-like helix-turn-helix DNA-binding protein [Terracidiphilus sp.]
MKLPGKRPVDDRNNWDEAILSYREQVRFYLKSLVHCAYGEQILANAEAEARERSVPDDFKLRFLVRTLVRNVIHHLRACAQTSEGLPRSAQDCLNPCEEIPAQERLVYFMRDILEYSTRDVSLLIGITDAQVETLRSFARKRIDRAEELSLLEMRRPEAA